MDAMDVNWCLVCDRHIDVEGNSPYCSRECYTAARSSTSSALASPAYRPFDNVPAAESISELDCDLCSRFESSISSTERSRWIGKGAAGIYAWARDVPPGPPSGPDHSVSTADLRPPKLLQTTRRPVPPSLCMSKTIPAPAPSGSSSRPPISSLPSLSSQCPTNTSVASLTTPSPSMYPASPVEAPVSPCPPTTTTTAVKGGLISALTAQVRSWTASSKECPRSQTVTRTSSAVRPRPRLHLPPLDDPAEVVHEPKDGFDFELDGYWVPSTEKLPLTDDHPAFRSRGRPSSRIIS
ncbi:hypothetical protein DAEQUDRAFT_764323 [Daedalea quercina L-15889]|uniref:Uncharacterized protein n=1 Tax=Daedalea quercina L-15889 TaxID=1314783 RepID=A0A165RH65_9APHY|nr:hypothetical protein DAEQUDRAFT_764323 [Daedalea quercina L-15889]